MNNFYVAVGDEVSFAKTVAEADVYLFAGITGDLAPVHTNEALMAETAYGRRIAHGALIIGFMSTTSSMMVEQSRDGHGRGETPVSLGYDRVRFLAPVFFGDTVTVTYRICAIDEIKRRSTAQVEAVNQSGAVVAVATHILKWVKKPDA